MNTKDSMHDQVSDEQFDAFLAGDDALSKLLRALPQPKPSAALNAAILAQAQAAHGGGQAATRQAAANDPPQHRQSAPRLPFFSRWKIPLSLAASVLLIAPIIWLQRPESRQDSQVLAQAPAAAAVAPAAEMAARPQNAASANPPNPQDGVASPSKDVRRATQAGPRPESARVAAKAKPAHQSETIAQTAQPRQSPEAAADSTGTSSPAMDVLAKAEQAQSDKLAREGMRITGRMDESPAKEAAAREPDHPNPFLAAAPIVVAAAPAPPVEEAVSAAPKSAPPAPVDFPAPKPFAPGNVGDQRDGPVGSRASAKEVKEPANAVPSQTMAARGKADNATSAEAAQPLESSDPQADAWLAKIEELIKDKHNQRALDEWAKFRKIYPHYEVPQGLSTQIKKISILKR